jgi:hypothetical protein
MTNPVRFGQDFVGRVANPRDILQYYRRKKAAERSEWCPSIHTQSRLLMLLAESKNLPDAPDMEDEDEEWAADDPAAMTANDRLSKLRMANLVKQYLQAQNLEENGLEDAVMRFVDKDDKDAIKEWVPAVLNVSALCPLGHKDGTVKLTASSFVADTLKVVGRDMRGKQVQEEDVEEHVSTSMTCLGSVLMPSTDDAGQGEVSAVQKSQEQQSWKPQRRGSVGDWASLRAERRGQEGTVDKSFCDEYQADLSSVQKKTKGKSRQRDSDEDSMGERSMLRETCLRTLMARSGRR